MVFIFGLIIGSFLNVLILRLPEKESLLGFSKCPACKKRIAWFDNIPVLSFFILGGRCRNCRAPISRQYPFVEASGGFLFLFSFLAWGANQSLWIYVAFLSVLFLAIGSIDFRRFIISDELLFTGLIGTILFFVFWFTDCRILSCSVSDSLYGVSFFAGVFLVIYLFSRGKWLGFGDVKLAALLGLIFGLEKSISTFYLTFLVGFIIAIILLGLGRAGLKTEIPLGAILSFASILFLLTGFNLLDLIDSELILRLLWRN